MLTKLVPGESPLPGLQMGIVLYPYEAARASLLCHLISSSSLSFSPFPSSCCCCCCFFGYSLLHSLLFFVSLPVRALPFLSALSSSPNYLPKIPPPNTITWASVYEFCGHTNIQSVATAHTSQVSPNLREARK